MGTTESEYTKQQTANGQKGGKKLLRMYGKKHFSELAKAGWAKRRAEEKAAEKKLADRREAARARRAEKK